jgi:2-keto-3-deoxy-galactonokinase
LRRRIGRGEIAIVGDAGLADLYAKGLAMTGGKARIVNGLEATLAGLKTAWQQS